MVCCFFFTKFPLEKKSVFSHTCSGGSPVMNIFLPPITDLFYNFSRRIFSRKTHIDRRLNSANRDFRKMWSIWKCDTSTKIFTSKTPHIGWGDTLVVVLRKILFIYYNYQKYFYTVEQQWILNRHKYKNKNLVTWILNK